MKVLLIIVVVLVGVRASLPSVIKHQVNKYLQNEIEGFTGSVEGVDLAIFRGAYEIEGLIIAKKDSTTPPLLQIDEIDLELSWKSLFRGQILAEVEIDEPRINIVDSQEEDKKQFAFDVDWPKILDRLIPIKIDKFQIKDGTVRIVNTKLKAPAEAEIRKIEVRASNLHNQKTSEDQLPSPFKVTGRIQNEFPFALEGAVNIMEYPLSLDLDFVLEDFRLNSINELLLAYVPLSFTKGTLSVYSEVASKEGRIKGYVKPFLKDIDVIRKNEDFKGFKHWGIEVVSAGSNLFFKNNKNQTSATKMEFHGSYKKPDIDADMSLGVSLENAFGDPISPSLENSIDITHL